MRTEAADVLSSEGCCSCVCEPDILILDVQAYDLAARLIVKLCTLTYMSYGTIGRMLTHLDSRPVASCDCVGNQQQSLHCWRAAPAHLLRASMQTAKISRVDVMASKRSSNTFGLVAKCKC